MAQNDAERLMAEAEAKAAQIRSAGQAEQQQSFGSTIASALPVIGGFFK